MGVAVFTLCLGIDIRLNIQPETLNPKTLIE